MPEIKIQSHPQMTVIGLLYHGKNEAGEIPQLWGKLMKRQGEIENRDFSVQAAYGISIMGPDYDETMVFDYIAGFAVKREPKELPDGMGKFVIPEGDYAVITCPSLDWISKAFDAVHRWIRESKGYVIDHSDGNFNFERYGEEFAPDMGSTKFTIHVPVKEK